MLTFRDKIYVPEALRIQVVADHHNSPLAGHFGRDRTLDLLQRNFWWKGIKSTVSEYTRRCQFCTQSKPDTHATHGRLLPIPPPGGPWERVGMDMITDLPKTKSTKSNCILVFVDHFTKMAHFVPCTKTLHRYDAADLLLNTVVRHHGLPTSIVTDRDPRWLNAFWKHLCARLDIRQSPTTAYHPQADGQTERINLVLENYRRTYVNWEQDN